MHSAVRRGRLRRPLAIATVLASLAAAVAVPSGVRASSDGAASVPGASITSERWVTDRTLELTVATPSLSEPTKVEVTLPVGYASQPSRRWPVTHYLGGTSHDQTAFRGYHGEELSASSPSIVVGPNGASGYWSDWYNHGIGGPAFETFVT